MNSKAIRRVRSKTGRLYEYTNPISRERKPTVHHSDFTYKPRWNSNKAGMSIRKQCLERDTHTCQLCGQTNPNLHIHHLDKMGVHLSRSPNNDLSNLQTLCAKCHQRLHSEVIEKHQEIIALRKAGLTLQEIGSQFGRVSRQRIHQILLKYICE